MNLLRLIYYTARLVLIISCSFSVLARGKIRNTKIVFPPVDVVTRSGTTVSFPCDVKCDTSLSLTVDWLFNGKHIDFDEKPKMIRRSDSSLDIVGVTAFDSGTYTCFAQTELDNATASASLIVLDAPNPPKIVNFKCKNQVAHIEWKPMGDNMAPILGYRVMYNLSLHLDVWYHSEDIPATDFKFQFRVGPWSKYSFRVVAFNKIGDSIPSETSQPCENSLMDVPYKNPENVQGKGSSPDNLVITWTPLSRTDMNAPGFFYLLRYRLSSPGERWESVDILDPMQSEYIITHQPTFKEYRIIVRSANSLGHANVEPSEVIGYSGEDEPLEPPTDLTLHEISDAYRAIISWNPVPPDSVRGHFKGYKIKIWKGEKSSYKEMEKMVPPNVTKIDVRTFPFSENNVHVLAFNGAYEGPPSNIVSFKTPEGRPGAVSALDVVPMGFTAVYVMWEKPKEPNGILTGYRIYYEEVSGGRLAGTTEWQPPTPMDLKKTRVKIPNLSPATTYRLTVRAENSYGIGDFYYVESSTQSRTMGRPGKPTFIWELLPNKNKTSSIKITWLPNVDGVTGSHFYVSYRIKGVVDYWTRTHNEEMEDTLILINLEPGTLYEVAVVSVEEYFETKSESHEIETPEAEPGPIAELTVVPMGSTAFYLMWKHPLKPYGKLTGYRIYYQEVKGTNMGKMLERKPSITDPTRTRAKLAGLRPETMYQITMCAVNSQGCGESYKHKIPTSIQTFDSPDKPSFTWKLLSSEDEKASIAITWLPNIEGVTGSSFYAIYKIQDASLLWQITPIEEKEDYLKLTDLEPGTLYEIAVVSINNEFENRSDSQEIETIGVVPGEPSFHWELLTNKDKKASVNITLLPSIHGHPGRYFYVQYRTKGRRLWNHTNIEENYNNIILDELQLGRIYEVRVIAILGEFTNFSETKEIGTTGAVPGKAAFTWMVLPNEDGEASINISRTLLNGSNASSFHVQYQIKGGQQLRNDTAKEENYDHIILTGLEPGRIYEVRLVASADEHIIDETEEIETIGTVPEKPDFTLKLLSDENKNTTVAILRLVNNLDLLGNSHFYAQYRIKGRRMWYHTDIKENYIIKYELDELNPETIYEIRLVTVNGELGNFSDIKEIETL